MAIEFGFYNSLNGDRRYNSTQMSEIFEGLITDGIYPSVGEMFSVTPGEGLQILVGTGRAWFDATWTRNRAKYPMNLDIPDPVFDRIDTVCLKVDKRQGVRANSLEIIKGTISAAPTAPTLPTTDPDVIYHPLANVRIKPAATSVTAANITVLVGTSACPFTTSILQQTNIDVLFANWTEQFMSWWNNLKTILDDDAVGNILNELDKKVNIADKATSAEAIAGTNDTHWMTPAMVKSTLSTYHQNAVGNILFSVVKPPETRYRNLSVARDIATTGVTLPGYIENKPRTATTGTLSLQMTKSCFESFVYNRIIRYIKSSTAPANPGYGVYTAIIPDTTFDAVTYNTYQTSTFGNQYCVGIVPITNSSVLVFATTSTSGQLTSRVVTLSSTGKTDEVVSGSVWTISTNSFTASNMTIIGKYQSGSTLMVVIANAAPGNAFTRIDTFTYSTTSPTVAPTVTSTTFSGYTIVSQGKDVIPSEQFLRPGNDSYIGTFLVANGTSLASMGITKSGSCVILDSSIVTVYSIDGTILDWNSVNSHVYIVYRTSSSGPVIIGKIDLLTGSIYSTTIVSSYTYRGSPIAVSGAYYNGILYVTVNARIGQESSINPIDLVLPGTYSVIKSTHPQLPFDNVYTLAFIASTTSGALTYTSYAAACPPIWSALRINSNISTLYSSIYKSESFVIGYYMDVPSSKNFWIVSNLVTEAVIVIPGEAYNTGAGHLEGAFAAIDTYRKDIFFNPIWGQYGGTSSTVYTGQNNLTKFSRHQIDITDNPLAPYMWIYM